MQLEIVLASLLVGLFQVGAKRRTLPRLGLELRKATETYFRLAREPIDWASQNYCITRPLTSIT